MLKSFVGIILNFLGVKIVNTATDMTKHKGLRVFALVNFLGAGISFTGTRVGYFGKASHRERQINIREPPPLLGFRQPDNYNIIE